MIATINIPRDRTIWLVYALVVACYLVMICSPVLGREPTFGEGVRRVVGCFDRIYPRFVRNVLNSPNDGSATAFEQMSRGVGLCGGMLGLNVTHSLPLVRGALAERYVRASPIPAIAALPIASFSPNPLWLSSSPSLQAVQILTHCLAYTKPYEALALVRSTPDTAAERAAFLAVQPFLGQCLDARMKLEVDLPNLRFALADALYHREVTTSASSARN